MTDPLAVDRIDALSYGQRVVSQRVVSQRAGGYALERQGWRFFVVRESDRNEVEVSREVVEGMMTQIAYGSNLNDLLRALWQSVKYDPREFDP